jgi:hypothetical protein
MDYIKIWSLSPTQIWKQKERRKKQVKGIFTLLFNGKIVRWITTA